MNWEHTKIAPDCRELGTLTKQAETGTVLLLAQQGRIVGWIAEHLGRDSSFPTPYRPAISRPNCFWCDGFLSECVGPSPDLAADRRIHGNACRILSHPFPVGLKSGQ